MDLFDVQNAFFHTATEFRNELIKIPFDPYPNMDDFDDLMTYHKNLEKSCAQILVGFLHYFSVNFDWKSQAVDVS